MKLLIKGIKMEVTQALKDYIEKKFVKLEKYTTNILQIDVECSIAKNPRIQNNCVVQATVYAKGAVIRGEHDSEDMYASVDAVVEKLEKQLKRYKLKKIEKIPKIKTSIAMTPEEKVEPETPYDEFLDNEIEGKG